HRPPPSPLFPYTTLFRSSFPPANSIIRLVNIFVLNLAAPATYPALSLRRIAHPAARPRRTDALSPPRSDRPRSSAPPYSFTRSADRKSTRLNSSHVKNSY